MVIQLAPAFAPVHVANIKALARGKYWDGATIYRVQDNYVAQWGLNESDKPWPGRRHRQAAGGIYAAAQGAEDHAARVSPIPMRRAPGSPTAGRSPISPRPAGPTSPIATAASASAATLSPDTGTGGELYAVIGHAPRQLDRNIAMVGRVIDGIDRLSSLPRGTEALGFYKDKAQYRADRQHPASPATCRRPSGRPMK